MPISRRQLLRSGALAVSFPLLNSVRSVVAETAPVKDGAWTHGLSLFGDVKYPAGFPHFDYVNPAAPKGGVVRQTAVGTFDNFNMVVAGVKGAIGAIGEIYEALTVSSLDEVSTNMVCSRKR